MYKTQTKEIKFRHIEQFINEEMYEYNFDEFSVNVINKIVSEKSHINKFDQKVKEYLKEDISNILFMYLENDKNDLLRTPKILEYKDFWNQYEWVYDESTIRTFTVENDFIEILMENTKIDNKLCLILGTLQNINLNDYDYTIYWNLGNYFPFKGLYVKSTKKIEK